MDATAVNSIRSASQPIYPGSHELRLEALIRVEGNLAPEGFLGLASFQKAEEPHGPVLAHTPAQTEELIMRSGLCDLPSGATIQRSANRDGDHSLPFLWRCASNGFSFFVSFDQVWR